MAWGGNTGGGDIASTASGRGRLTTDSNPLRAVKPPNASARAGILVLSVGNGCTRVMRPQSVSWVRTGWPDQPGSMRWCRYHGRDVTTCR